MLRIVADWAALNRLEAEWDLALLRLSSTTRTVEAVDPEDGTRKALELLELDLEHLQSALKG